jgi:Tol biopolymer transport system component
MKFSNRIIKSPTLRFGINLLILVSLTCISLHLAVAGSNPEQVNATIIADLNQTVGEDLLSLVDTDVYEGGNTPFFNVIWSPDGDQMLIQTSVFLHIIGGGDFGSGTVQALYLANADGSDLKRVAWGESNSSNGKNIRSPVWSQSGDYFAYVEESTVRMYKKKSSQLTIMSNDLEPIHKIDQDINISGVLTDPVMVPFTFKWSPTEDKIITFTPGNVVVYEPYINTSFTFDIGNDYFDIDDIGLSEDGKKFSFSLSMITDEELATMNEEIIVVDIENRILERIYSAHNVGMYGAKWSPDSNKLVFYEISGSEKNSTLRYDVYVKNVDTDTPVKVTSFYSGSSGIRQWYPDSERLLAEIGSDNSHELISLSINGDIDKLFTGDSSLDGMVSKSGYVLATKGDSYSSLSPYFKTQDLVLLDAPYQLEIEDVPYYRLEDDDLILVKNSNVSVVNISTNDTCYVSIPAMSHGIISLNPSGHSMAVDGYIMELQGFEKQAVTSVGNDTYGSVPDEEDVISEMNEQVETGNNGSISSFINEKVDAFFGAVTEILEA